MTLSTEELDAHRTVGIIGLGSMGGMLLAGFIDRAGLEPADVVAATRSAEKRSAWAARRPGLALFADNREAASRADILFVCVKPLELRAVLDGIVPALKPDCHLVSIAAGVSLDLLASRWPGKASRLIPSLASEVGLGVSLVCHGPSVPAAGRAALEALLAPLGRVAEIPEDQFAIGSDLTSCAPGLIAAIFEEFVAAALPHGRFSREEAAGLVRATLHGTARLMDERRLDFGETIARVATKGGLTEAGVASLRRDLPAVFAAMYEAIRRRQDQRGVAIRASFG
jgi:pyrroline-5-carboxylate reductase